MPPADPVPSRASDAHVLDAFAALREERTDDAILAAERAIPSDPASGLYALALAAAALGTPARALALLEQAHAHDSEALEIADALAAIHARVGHVNESLYYAKLATALQSRPLLASAPNERLGSFFGNLERGRVDFHHARARKHLELGNATEAMAEATAQLELTPGDPASLRTLALAGARRQETGRAIDAGRALLHTPAATANDLSCHAVALAADGRFAAADACHALAETVAGDDPLPGQRRLADLGRDPDLAPLERRAAQARWRARHAASVAPWPFSPGPFSPGPLSPGPLEPDRALGPERGLAVGYLCGAIFGTDAADLLEILLAGHRAERARAVCYVEGRRSDPPTERLIRAARRWTDLEGVDDETACQIMRGDRLDILVDLAGFAAGGRPLVLQRRPAPCVIALAGAPDAAGLPGVDVLLGHGAELAEAPPARSLAGSRPLVAWRPPSLAPALSPRDAGEPLRIAVLGDPALLSPARIGWLAEVLHARPEARLTLVGGRDRGPAQRAADAFADFGQRTRIDLIDAAENGFATGFELFRYVDVGLLPAATDAHLEVCRALWMGVPVVAAPGVGRGASVLAAAGRAAWIAADRASFVATAAALTADRPGLETLRAGLRAELERSPLLDLAGFAAAIRDAYRRAWRASGSMEATDAVA